MKKLLLLAVIAISLIACTERGDDFVNSQPNENERHYQSRPEEEPVPAPAADGQDPAIIVPPRR